MKKVLPIILLLLAAIIAGFTKGCCDCETKLDTALRDGATDELQKEGYTGIDVQGDHFDVELNGVVASEAKKAQAGELLAARLPGGNITNNLTIGAIAAAGGAAIAAAPEPAPEPIPAPAPPAPAKIASIKFNSPDGSNIDRNALGRSLGFQVGDVYEQGFLASGAKNLGGIDGIQSASLNAAKAGNGDYDITATVTPTPPKKVQAVAVPTTGDADLDRALAAVNPGTNVGDLLRSDSAATMEERLESIDGIKDAKVTVEETADGYKLNAMVTPEPKPEPTPPAPAPAPKPDLVQQIAVRANGVDLPKTALAAAIGLNEGDAWQPDTLDGAADRLRKLPGVAEASVSSEKVPGGYRIVAKLTPPKPEPKVVKAPAPKVAEAPKPAPKPAPAPPKQPAAGLAGLADLPIYFRPGHVCVDASDIGKLRSAVKIIKAAGNDDPISLVGFSDPTGTSSDAARDKMALRRAAEVRNLMIDMGINRNIISTRSGGIDRGDGTKASYEHSRRVEIRSGN